MMFQTRRKANDYRDIGIILLIPAVLSLLLGAMFGSIAITLFAIPFFIACAVFLENSVTWSSGAEGEEKVAECLEHLNESYFVIHDVVLPRMVKENIDHVVLGPNGIFVIETKNHKGYITCHGDWWKQRKIGRRGTPYLGNIGSPSKQVKRKAVLLSEFIQNHFGVKPFINAVVVFTNEEARLKRINPTVAVLRLHELRNFIQYYRSTSKAIELKELEAVLKPYSRFE